LNRDANKCFTVAQVVGTFGGGGAQRLAYSLASALAGRGARSLAIAVREIGSYHMVNQNGVVVRELGCRAGSPLSLLRGARRLRSIVGRENIDVLHVHGTGTLPFVDFAMRGFKGRPAVFFTWHDSESVLEGPLAKTRRLTAALRRCDQVYGSSASVSSRLRERAGLAGVSTFRNGVAPIATSGQVGSSTPLIVWSGRLVPTKDPQALIRAAAALRRDRLAFRVAIAGTAPNHLHWFAEQTRALIHDEGLDEVVEIRGWVDDVPALLRESAIGVQTSHTEGLSMTLLEQMMAGLAVVATDVGDTAVAIEHGKTGLLVPPGDDDALCDALRRLITDVELRCRLGAAAREKALAEFSLEAMAEQGLRFYREPVGCT